MRPCDCHSVRQRPKGGFPGTRWSGSVPERFFAGAFMVSEASGLVLRTRFRRRLLQLERGKDVYPEGLLISRELRATVLIYRCCISAKNV